MSFHRLNPSVGLFRSIRIARNILIALIGVNSVWEIHGIYSVRLPFPGGIDAMIARVGIFSAGSPPEPSLFLCIGSQIQSTVAGPA